MSARADRRPRSPRHPSAVRWIRTAEGFSGLSLVLLLANSYVPADPLLVAALSSLGAAFASGWAAVLTWRMPVLGRRGLAAVTAAWGIGVAASVGWAEWGARAGPAPSLQWATWGLAITCSLLVGALFLRALLRRRASSLLGRLLSLITPVAVLTWIVHSAIRR